MPLLTFLRQWLDEQYLSFQTILAVSTNTFFYLLKQVIIKV